MAVSSARAGSYGENIQHLSHVRLRITGSGIYKQTVYSLDDVSQTAIPDLPMNSVNGIEPTRLANFVSQRISLEGKTTEINEYFRINRIILFTKEYGSEFPM